MSRTYKDLHYMVAEHYTEHHHWTCSTGRAPCTLPDRKKIRDNYYSRRFTYCWLEPKHDRIWWHASCPKWFRDHRWNNPQRVKVRDIGRKIVAEYNAGGYDEVTEVPTAQHHHGATWEYW